MDLQKIKLTNAQQPSQEGEEEGPSSKPPENPPPRISDKKQFKMASYDANANSDAPFADFTQFPTEANVSKILVKLFRFSFTVVQKNSKVV